MFQEIQRTAEKAVHAADHVLSREDPTWYKDAIIYQLHVKSFYDSNNDGIGDFNGLIEKLDYIASLGVNTVWLLPFYPSPLRDDGYDIADYYGVHPDYGKIEDVQKFIQEAHNRGLRIITELVINHTSDQHPWFQRARKAPPGSPERDFYVWSDTDEKYTGTRIIFLDTENSNWTWDPEAKAYFWHRFYSHQPDLNFDNPAVLDSVLEVMKYWLDMGVDGLRLDAVPYLVEREGTINENLPETHSILKRIRAEVDKNYPGRLLLAEANQWPEDTQEYFGKGDECHMAFHFPLMPRMYMALAQEDRYPITDILRQTPVIPENCQWAIFLRNHDELTLEMVTDKERDYLWNQYASDNRARLNLGIRRRLAPLMQRDRRRIEVLNSLLFSMPGTPIIYYGDELSMGDNIYLGDRDGVRTPMQWSPDRNGGFSKADPSQLMLPPIMDPLYGYNAVNVEAQARDSHSLLSWTRLMLDIRKHYRAFGRGSFKMLYPANRRILAYIREYTPEEGDNTETILCLVNVSRTAQAVELDLSAYAGFVPLEMTGGSSFPPIGKLPYLLTLPPYGFYWFLLADETEYPEWYTPPPEPMPEHITLVIRNSVADVLKPPIQEILEKDILPAYLPKRRWFGAKDAKVTSTWVRYSACLPRPKSANSKQESATVALAEVEVSFGDHTQCYQIPLAIFFEDLPVPVLAHQLALARTRRRQRVGVLTDGVASEAFAQSVLELLHAAEPGDGSALSALVPEKNLGGDDLLFIPTNALASAKLDEPELEIRTLSVEQSNSSVIIGERAVLKLLRRVFTGRHPEVDMSGVLTASGFANTAPLLGHVCRRNARGEPVVLAVLQGYIHNQGNGWEWMLTQLDRLNEDTAAIKATEPSQENVDEKILLLENSTLDDCDRFARAIGHRLGEMHCILSQQRQDPAFSTERAASDTVQRWAASVKAQMEGAIAAVKTLAASDSTQANFSNGGPSVAAISDNDRHMIDTLITKQDTLLRKIDALAECGEGSLLFRIHGDLHLGQILVAQDDAYFIDFEGEPTRSLAERSAKNSPFRDVAGVLRSLQYVSETAAAHNSIVDNDKANLMHLEFLKNLEERATAAFLEAYREASSDIDHQWQRGGEDALIRLFTLEKAAYEISYEAANRPGWIYIPLRGLAAITRELQIDL